VKQSGGAIGVYSEPGVGTVFKVYLPSAAGPAIAHHPHIDVAPPRGTETVLVVEDDEPVRAAVARILRGCGYDVLVAADGHEAVAAISQRSRLVDLVLTDVIIPRGSGPEIADALRAGQPGLRFLFMSGYTDHPTLKRAAIRGVEANFIQKPFSPDALARKVREVLTR
jgi:two-component system, cell cycle sensor histidine kinase and response regulator CckA